MRLNLDHPTREINGKLVITGSKSETNRLLILQALYPQLTIENRSNSDDAVAMQNALHNPHSPIDVHHAGTAMRFLTAYFSNTPGEEILLTGSKRMQERPIGLLVDALETLGACIGYEKNIGYPPLRIKGAPLNGGRVTLPANISSQYISALLLIAPKLAQGLVLELEGEITSLPYIKMTLALLKRLGISSEFTNQTIRVPYCKEIPSQTQTVESDWSSASYWFSVVALSDAGEIHLNNYRKDSLQGDAVLVDIYQKMGVESYFEGEALVLKKKTDFIQPQKLEFNLIEAPDIAQTIAVTCYGMGIEVTLTGLHTLKIKETDRLLALENELKKLGASIRVDAKSLSLAKAQNFNTGQAIDTYHDHRMAMAFAPLALRVPLTINDAGVVSKSYPEFWSDMKSIGFQLIEK